MTFCIYYYIDGKIVKFCSTKTKWRDLPKNGVLIHVRDGVILNGQNYYSETDNYESSDPNIKRGMAIKDGEFWDLWEKVKAKKW